LLHLVGIISLLSMMHGTTNIKYYDRVVFETGQCLNSTSVQVTFLVRKPLL